jgi:leader peptidase (prepilin peptidase)/N-methyltransferase
MSALIFAISYFRTGDLIHGAVVGLVFTLLLGRSIIDFRYKAVPDRLNLSALTLAIFSSTFILSNFINALLFAGGFSLLRFYVSYAIKKEALGEADIMIAATIGAMVGVKMGLFTIFLSAIIALPVFIIIKEKDYEVPFIPFLALALFIVYMFQSYFEKLWISMYG